MLFMTVNTAWPGFSRKTSLELGETELLILFTHGLIQTFIKRSDELELLFECAMFSRL